jgi:hypothetical protein
MVMPTLPCGRDIALDYRHGAHTTRRDIPHAPPQLGLGQIKVRLQPLDRADDDGREAILLDHEGIDLVLLEVTKNCCMLIDQNALVVQAAPNESLRHVVGDRSEQNGEVKVSLGKAHGRVVGWTDGTCWGDQDDSCEDGQNFPHVFVANFDRRDEGSGVN